jgi:hypothetical protein
MVATNLPNYKGQLTNKLRLLPRFPRVVNERIALFATAKGIAVQNLSGN